MCVLADTDPSSVGSDERGARRKFVRPHCVVTFAWHVRERPAGACLSSAKELCNQLKLITLIVNRGGRRIHSQREPPPYFVLRISSKLGEHPECDVRICG